MSVDEKAREIVEAWLPRERSGYVNLEQRKELPRLIATALREARAEALEEAAERLWASEYGAVSGTLRAMAATERSGK